MAMAHQSSPKCWCDHPPPLSQRLLAAERCALTCDRSTIHGNKYGTIRGCTDCSYYEHRAGHGEDLILLPTLLRAAAGGGAGTFVEIGALDGVSLSNTIMLERCFNWTGLLIEANPENFAKLRRSGRRAAIRHSAVCPHDQKEIEIATTGGPTASQPEACQSTFWRSCNTSVTKVPCSPLKRLMREHGLAAGATFLSLDVEGAEALVLDTVDPAAFKVALIEFDGTNKSKDARVHEQMTRAGMRMARDLTLGRAYLGGVNRLYLRDADSMGAHWSPHQTGGMGQQSCNTRCGNVPVMQWLEARASTPPGAVNATDPVKPDGCPCSSWTCPRNNPNMG